MEIFYRLLQIRNEIVRLNTTTNFFTSLVASGDENNTFSSKRILSKNILENDKQQRQLLFEAYEKIQLLRQYLTGEVLVYNLYIATDKEIKKISIPGDQLDKYFSLTKKEITLRQSAVKAAWKESEEAIKLQKQWKEVIKRFRHPKKGEGYESFWIYTGKNILRHRDANPPPPRAGSAQVFNLGHIIEAVDQANMQIPPQNNFFNLFEEALEYDSISGFKGGDNGMIQVKANQARLMRYSSIMNALDAICSLQDNFSNPTEAMKTISDVYFSSNISSEVSTRIQKFIEEKGEELVAPLENVAKS